MRSMLALLLAVLLCQSALANPPFDEMQLQAYAARREALLRDGKVNVPEMSLAIRSAIKRSRKAGPDGRLRGCRGQTPRIV
jgi:hypothetical protein